MFQIKSSIAGAVWPAVPTAPGAAILAALFQLERSQWWTVEALWSKQREQLRVLLQHAARSSPFYREAVGDFLAGAPAEFSPEQFAALPVLTRRDLQRHHDRIASSGFPAQHGRSVVNGTSGSTGEPVQFISTDLTNFYWQAFNLRDHLWHERDLTQKLVVVRVGTPAGRMKNWFGDVGDTTLETGPCILIPGELGIAEQARQIEAEDPAYLTGYFNNLIGILEHLEAGGRRLPHLRQVRSLGEAVTAEGRDYVNRRWKVPLIDMYTTREAGYVALQCPAGDGYHVQSEGVHVEVIGEDGRACKAGETGRVVVTPLHNFAFPMIRYDQGDYAEVGAACPCGRGLPVLRRIHGRSRNLMKLRDGSVRWPGLGTQLFRELAPVRQFQVIQHGFDDIEIKLAVERALTEAEKQKLGDSILEHLRHRFRIQWTFLPEIARGGGWKFEDFVRAFDP